MHSLNRILISAVIALLLCLAEGALFATATSAAELPRSVSVRYSGLNLDRPGDVATLYQRIAVAADDACAPRLLTGSRQPLPSYQRCVSLAIAQAVARVDRPALSAYHQQQLGLAAQREPTIAQR
ncbi:MAG TPA: UrcA family protein [Steroidobacteraceae bacterium]